MNDQKSQHRLGSAKAIYKSYPLALSGMAFINGIKATYQKG
jgi:hypothetical protein